MKKIIWVDDERDPEMMDPTTGFAKTFIEKWNDISFHFDEYEYVWCKNYDSFVDELLESGLPDAVCFDHDLGYGKNGKDCANYLVEYAIDNAVPYEKFPVYSSQSFNPTGRMNILSLLDNFKKKYYKIQ